jgi:hypothetical protein
MATALFLAVMVFLFVGAVACQLLGHRFGVRRQARGEAAAGEGTSAVEASLFALLGLLIAFMVSGGEARLNVRRELIVKEATAIGTAYIRLDLLPEAARPQLREQFREYVDARIAFYRQLLNFSQARIEHSRAERLQDQIWKDAVAAAAQVPDVRATMLVVPALNEMFDVMMARDAALRTHIPWAIFILLILLAFACSFLAGLGMSKSARPSTLHVIAFAAMLSVTAYVLLNLELPRAGLIRLAPIDALLSHVRASMN